ncbi:hypothetical protein PIB30_048828 [Stylosanthes scabra]|uniref:Zinc finger GRF-type domain-containing protein n=1 Tax=Stylosanthes scabra TaxID=79078 RepID=A0ABU6SH20_9FABA|nr:hypothetical protein [Stylosanthes scabra]
MESAAGSSASRKRSSGTSGERSSSSTQGFFSVKVGNERDGATPKCHCGVYAVLYLSKTSNNPNILFFGCPFFKVRLNHCKYFLWLDQHAAKLGRDADPIVVKEDLDNVDDTFVE